MIVAALAVGLLSGAGALEAGATAQPAIRWSDIPFVFFGSVFGMLFCIGIQLFRRDPTFSRWALRILGTISLWIAASGLSALALAAFRGEIAPFSVLFVSVGLGCLIGGGICLLLFRWRFKTAL